MRIHYGFRRIFVLSWREAMGGTPRVATAPGPGIGYIGGQPLTILQNSSAVRSVS